MVNVRLNDVRRVRRQAMQAIRLGVYALAIVSDGRRYRVGAKTTGDSVICFEPRKYEKLAHAEAVCHTKFPGVEIVRVSMTKPKAKKAAA
jgi:hypothetical protein